MPTMSIRWARNIQHRNRVMWSPLIPSSDSRLCSQTWVRKMINIIPAAPTEPFFLVREGKDWFPLTTGQIGRILKLWCDRAGVEGNYTPHCLRRGGLTWAHKAKLMGEVLQILGGWASRAYLRYIDHDFESRVKSGKEMAALNL